MLIQCDICQVVTIDVLPDDVLLAIFDFYVVRYQDLDFVESAFGTRFGTEDTIKKMRSWQTLVHVCRRWRGLVFGSPRRLDLRLYCTTRTPARKTLDDWPALPLRINGDVFEDSVDDVVAVLQHSDRICQINLRCHTTLQIEKLWTTMKLPFPDLASLCLSTEGLSHVPALPDSFLGGSAPRLRFLCLHSIPFPGSPVLLLTATHLVSLWLLNIPHSGYISPDAMVTCLSMLVSLEQLQLAFESPQSSPDQENRRSPPPTRTVLPALISFSFKGVSEYLEELVTRIDTPQLRQFWTTFFNDIGFDIPKLIQFITLTFDALKDAHVVFDTDTAWITFQRLAPSFSDVRVEISCRVPNWQLSSLGQIGTSFLLLLSTTENLYIYEYLKTQIVWEDDIENIELLELLFPFTAVKDLYISKQFAPRIAPALRELTGGSTAEVLPTLENLFLEGFQPSEQVHEGIRQFISARQLTNRPVTISIWERDPMSLEVG